MENTQNGAFRVTLKRNNSKIRDDRADSIIEDAQLIYKRQVEDLELKINQMKRDQMNMLDLSPTTADSLVMPSDFKSTEFAEKDLRLGIDIRNAEIALDIAKKRYKHLFVAEFKELTPVE